MNDAELQQLQKDVNEIKATLATLSLSDRYMFSKNIQVQDGRSILAGGTKGLRIGTSNKQKLGFFGKAPAAQQNGISGPSGGSTTDTQARAAIVSIINALHNLGLTA